MPQGGKRENAGRPKGSLNKETVTKESAYAAVRRRIYRNADKIINAQLANAVGSIQIFKVEEVGEGKFEHTLVTDPQEIKKVLDEGYGSNCSVNGGFYMVTNLRPETKAQDSMLDRAFGKPTQEIVNINYNQVFKEAEGWVLAAFDKHAKTLPHLSPQEQLDAFMEVPLQDDQKPSDVVYALISRKRKIGDIQHLPDQT